LSAKPATPYAAKCYRYDRHRAPLDYSLNAGAEALNFAVSRNTTFREDTDDMACGKLLVDLFESIP
jgi:hypothetical protein